MDYYHSQWSQLGNNKGTRRGDNGFTKSGALNNQKRITAEHDKWSVEPVGDTHDMKAIPDI